MLYYSNGRLKYMNIIKSLATVSFFTLISKLTGFFRSMLMTSILGATAISDALIMGLKIANLLRKIFAEGAFNSAFIPTFSKFFNRGDIGKARALASTTFSFLLWLMIAVSILAIIFYEQVLMVFAPGFDGERLDVAVRIGRILFPFIITACLVALMSSVLNTFGKFALPSSIQILINVASIIALIVSDRMGLNVPYVVAITIVIAGIVQVGVLWFYLYFQGFTIKLKTQVLSPELKKILINMCPSIAAVGIYELNSIVANRFMSTLGHGVVSYLFYADQIVQLPFSVFGIALGSALLPTFSSTFQKKRVSAMNFYFNKTLMFSLGLTLPSAVAISFMAQVVVGFIYGRGCFDVNDVLAVSSVLQVTILALPLQALIKIASSLFFARDDSSTPMRGALINFCANFAIIAAMINSVGYLSVAYATVFAALFNAVYLWANLPKSVYLLKIAKRIVAKQLISTTILGFYCYFAGMLWDEILSFGEVEKIFSVAAIVAGGMLIYGFLGHKLGFVDYEKIFEEFKR